MERSVKSSGNLILAVGIFAIMAILVVGEIGQAEGGNGVLSGIKNFLFTGFGISGEVFEQTFSHFMSTEAETRIVISHSHGNITVRGWDKDEVKLEGTKIVSARNKETAQTYAEQMKVETKSEDGRIIVETIRPKRERSWGMRKITINYELYAPHRLNVTLKNSHGNVIVDNFAGKLDLDCRHGNLQIAQIGQDAFIEHEHGNVEASQIGGNASVNMQHGKLKIGSVGGGLEMNHQHGNADLAVIGAGAHLTMQHGNLTAADVVGMLKLDHEHGNVRLKVIEGNIEINKQHGNIHIETVNGDVSIHSEHGTLEIIGIEGDVHLRGAHGNAHVENVSGLADISRSHCKASIHDVGETVPR